MGIVELWLGLAGLSALIWIFLLGFWGQFWRCDQRLEATETPPADWPAVCAVVPARNEADVLPQSLRSLLQQDYPGPFTVVLVDDQSTDGTGIVAQQLAQDLNQDSRLQILTTTPLPSGWSGKLWAMHQGVEYLKQRGLPAYLLFTDADIAHPPQNVQQLVAKAEHEQRELVSLMVLLRCDSIWEQLLIPAFVFFFQKLYPFPWVNRPTRKMAAAAGGCILVSAPALERAGGLEVIRDALIDDCSLAAAIKSSGRDSHESGTGNIWLGLTTETVSLRPYQSLNSIWTMVARTAFTQLHYSTALLLGSTVGMGLVYLVAPLGVGIGAIFQSLPLLLLSGMTWSLMALAYWPTIRLYRLSPLWTLALPLIALLYMLMTLDSARRHWQGQGGAWKGRVYP